MKDHADIPVAPETLWPYVADPLLMGRWNPKLVSIERTKTGPVTCGERYDALYKLGHKEHFTHVEVADVLSCEKVTYRQTVDGQNGYVSETYSLSSLRGGTRITQRIDLSHWRIPFFVRLVIAFLHACGKPVDEKILERLRRIVAEDLGEHGVRPP